LGANPTQKIEAKGGDSDGWQVRAQEEPDRQVPLQPAREQRQVIATSETYNSKAAAENGIRSVKENAPKATVDDQT
jgi:uncharacterized protein DUF1508